MKVNWKPGPPTTKGIFWFDNGLHERPGYTVRYPWVAQSIKYQGKIHTHLFADYGSGPLSMSYDEKLFKENNIVARHARIKLPKRGKWVLSSELSRNTRRAWVKSPEGYVGLALVRHHSYPPSGDIVWKNHPTSGSVCGEWFRDDEEGYLFYPIEEPNVLL